MSIVSSNLMSASFVHSDGIVCPHCWYDFTADQLLFISESPDLIGDTKLGQNEQARFLPVRFDLHCNALDAKSVPCRKTACPNCHLPIPRSLLTLPRFILSIAGAPASGKSFYLTALTWQLRKTLAREFHQNFTDADATMNRRIIGYESTLFMPDNSNEIVSIEKTDITGSIYNMSFINGHTVQFAQPFIFEIAPANHHPLPSQQERQAVFIYDNAGESFLPGAEKFQQPVTQHLAQSDAVLFLFDPTQDARFRQACKLPVDDPQMQDSMSGIRKSPVRQETVLTELINRLRYTNHLSPKEKYKVPFIIVLTKFDAWKQLTSFSKTSNPWKQASNVPLAVYNFNRVEEHSRQLRQLMSELIPDLTATVESFAEKTAFIAVSATGKAPQQDPKTGMLGYRSGDIHPYWVEVPFFHAQVLSGRKTVLPGKNKDSVHQV